MYTVLRYVTDLCSEASVQLKVTSLTYLINSSRHSMGVKPPIVFSTVKGIDGFFSENALTGWRFFIECTKIFKRQLPG